MKVAVGTIRALRQMPFANVVRQLLVPDGLLVGIALVAVNWRIVALPVPRTADFIALTICAGGALLAWRFRAPRLLLGLLLIAMSTHSLASSASADLRPAGIGGTLASAISLLLPLNFVLLLVVDDDTFDLETFGWWAGVVLVQAFAVAILCRPENRDLLDWLWQPIFTDAAIGRVPQLGSAAFLVAVLLLLSNLLCTPRPANSGLFWSCCASFLALNASSTQALMVYFVTAAVVMVVAVVEASYCMAYHDELTGLPGRRAFNDAVSLLSGEYSIAMVDVDHFKKFNDTFGHDVGDQVLRMVASRLANAGGGGKAFRCGGEEFAVIFRHTGAAEAMEHAEGLRRRIEESTFVVRGPDRSRRERPERRSHFNKHRVRGAAVWTAVTVSIGVAELGQDDITVQDVIRSADRALYRAKELGRNRVELWSPRPSRSNARLAAST
ncbi:MAG: diguanylate cyclase [Terriglobales bacterium]